MADVTHSFSFVPAGAVTRSASAPRAGDFSRTKIAVLFVVLMVIASIPILLNPLPPISDYINHLARMQVIATINSDPDLARYYEIDWQVIPNLMMDLIVPLFARVMNIYLAGQIYTLLSFALILSGTVALHRQLFGRWSALPLIASVLLYNTVFLVGTMNYVFGIGLLLWAMAAWVGLRDRGPVLRLLMSTLSALGLFFCHLFALGVYAVGLLAFESHRLWTGYARVRRTSGRAAARRALPSLVLDFVITGVPFLPVLALLLMSPTRGLWDFYWEPYGKLDGLLFVVEVYSHAFALVFVAAVALAMGWALRHRALSFHAFGFVLLAIGAVIYIVLPRVMFETYMVDQRLPISLAFILVACINVDFRHPIMRRSFAVVLVAFAVLRVAEVEDTWSRLSGTTQSFLQSVQLLNRGAKVAVAYDDPTGGDQLRDYGLVHADCIAIIERSALVTTAFTVEGKQVLHARVPYRSRVDTQDGTPPMIGRMVQVATDIDNDAHDYWRRWPSDYDYLYVLFTNPDFQNPDPAHLTEIFAGDRFMLYRIEKSQITVQASH
jgi:hypothetical protein